MAKKPKWRSSIVGHEKVRADQLLANPANHRRHPQKQRDIVSASIEELGFCKSVIVNKRTGNIVDGHERVMQALGVGDDTLVDVEYVDLSEADEKKLLLVLDASSELAEVDADSLDALLRDVQTGSDDLGNWFTELAEATDLLGDFSDDEINEDDVPEPPVDPITKPGDLWILGDHRLLCGDSSDQSQVDRLLAGATIDCVLTDPPYGINFKGSNASTLSWKPIHGDDFEMNLSHVLNMQCTVISFGANNYPSQLPHRGRWICWDKRKPDGACDAMIGSPFELAWTNRKSGFDKIYRFLHGGALIDGKPGRRQHPTQKSVRLICAIMDDYCKSGEMVYDPFLGSGTTLIAAEQLGRKCYGMEISPQYCDVIVKRWENLTGRKAVKG